MLSVPAIALSGMRAAQAALGASAHNIASAGAAGVRRLEAVPSAAAAGGVDVAIVRSGDASLESDVVGQLVAKHAFLANLAVFRASDRMTGTLLDTVG